MAADPDKREEEGAYYPGGKSVPKVPTGGQVTSVQLLRQTAEEGVYELVSVSDSGTVIADFNKAQIDALPAAHTVSDLETALKGE